MAANTDLLKKYKSLFSTTLSIGIGTGTSDTITPATVAGLPTDTAITLTFDRVDSGGVATPSKIERIVGVISGGNLSSYVRGKDNTTEQAHSGNAVIEMVWNSQDLNDMIDWALVEHNQNGTHGAVTATSVNIGSTIAVTGVLDEDTMSSNSAVKVATQQSIKAYVDTHIADTTTHGTTGAIVGISDTQTLTNKRITQRVVTTTDDATAVIDVDVTDQYQLTAVANATTISTTGTPTNGQKLVIRLKDAGVGKALTWDAVFRAVGVTLPTTTVANKTHYIGCIYNSADSKFDCVAVVAQA